MSAGCSHRGVPELAVADQGEGVGSAKAETWKNCHFKIEICAGAVLRRRK